MGAGSNPDLSSEEADVAFETKVYVVQKFDREDNPGEVLAVKLTRQAAHQVALENAPAKLIFAVADKSSFPNVVQGTSQQSRS